MAFVLLLLLGVKCIDPQAVLQSATITLIRQIGTSIAPALLITLVGATPSMQGYRSMLLCVALFNACAFATMLFYRSPRSEKRYKTCGVLYHCCEWQQKERATWG